MAAGSRTVRWSGYLAYNPSRTPPSAFASEIHVSRRANRNVGVAHSSPSPHALGTVPGSHRKNRPTLRRIRTFRCANPTPTTPRKSDWRVFRLISSSGVPVVFACTAASTRRPCLLVATDHEHDQCDGLPRSVLAALHGDRDSQIWALSSEDFAEPAPLYGVQCQRRALQCVPSYADRSGYHRSPVFRQCEGQRCRAVFEPCCNFNSCISDSPGELGIFPIPSLVVTKNLGNRIPLSPPYFTFHFCTARSWQGRGSQHTDLPGDTALVPTQSQPKITTIARLCSFPLFDKGNHVR